MKEYYPIMIILFGLVKSQVLISHHRCSASEEALQNSEAKMQTLLESIVQTKSDSQRVCKDEIEALKEEMREENEILKREVERMKNTLSLANGTQQNQKDEIKTLKGEIEEENKKLKRKWERMENILTFTNDRKDCLWYKITNENATSGVYDLKVGTREFSAYCDMETDGGGWTAVLSRYTNTSVDFQRTWIEYKKGFGNISESYWIGNDIFHELTEGRPSEMYFLMHPYYSPYVSWQKYKHVTVQSEELNYRLNFDENSFQGNGTTKELPQCFIKTLFSNGRKHLASKFNFIFRNIDNVLSINNPNFKNHLHEIYPHELEINETTDSDRSASYLDILLTFYANGHLSISLNDKRDDFSFHVLTNFPFMRSNIPPSLAYGVFVSQLIRYTRACSRYEYFIVRARPLASKLLVQGYIAQQLKSSLRKFFGRYGDIIKAYQISLSRLMGNILDCD